MRGSRVLLILMLVIGLVILAVAGILYINANDAPDVATDQGGTPGTSEEGIDLPTPVSRSDFITVVVSLQTVPRGWQMTEAELTTDLRLISEVGANVITDTTKAIGLYARTDIYQGETLTQDALVKDPRLIGRNNYGPSSLIPPGWIAASVPMDRLNSVAYGMAAGDSVDIMMTFAFVKVDEEFQTLLQNSATFILEVPNEEGELQRSVIVLDPYGRFEQLPTGDIAHIYPSEDQRPLPVSIVLQNAKVIQVGPWTPSAGISTPTPIPEEGAPTPTPGGFPTPTAQPSDVVVIALPPQQQLFLKYAVENSANIDFALRGSGDGQLYNVQGIDINYILQRFNIEIPPNGQFIISPSQPPLIVPQTTDVPPGDGSDS